MKYVMTEKTQDAFGVTLHQIKAVKSFGEISEGDLGGWIEKEENLSHEGNCWIAENAWAQDNARVFEDAVLTGESWAYENAQVYGRTKMVGSSRVYGNAKVYEDAYLRSSVHVHQDAQVFGDTWVSGEAQVWGSAMVYGKAEVGGNANVFGQAHICGDARVAGDAKISGDARISSKTDALWFAPIGSEDRTLAAYLAESKQIRVSHGYFEGTLEEFQKAFCENPEESAHAEEYKTLIGLIKRRLQRTA